MKLKTLLLAFALIGLAGAVRADMLWYGGDPDRVNGLLDGRGSGADANVYDDFDLTGAGAKVTGVFGVFEDNGGGGPSDSAEFEIRTGASNHDGGTLLATGTVAASSEFLGTFNELNFDRTTISGLNIGKPMYFGW